MSILSTSASSTAAPSASAGAGAGAGLIPATQSSAEMSQQFLKLLVTQLKNQDPLNPVDNAQMTSQMAQISTVGGIQSLNTSVNGLNTSLLQMQALQGAALVGREVTLPGKLISVANGAAGGIFDVSATADAVRIDVLNAAGVKVDSLSLGAQSAGQHSFNWPNGSGASPSDGYSFQVYASRGADAVDSTTLMRDKVQAISTSGGALTLDLARSGKIPYTAVTAIN